VGVVGKLSVLTHNIFDFLHRLAGSPPEKSTTSGETLRNDVETARFSSSFRNILGEMRKRSSVLIAALLTVGTVACVTTVGREASEAAAGRTWFVAPAGDDGDVGTVEAPLQTIERAVEQAASGDTIVLGGGVYHESVQVYGKSVHITSAPGQRAVLDGARPVEGWTASGGDWVVEGWTREFDVESGGPVSNDRPLAGRPDQVFLAGTQLAQVTSRDAVAPGSFFHDTAADRLWIGDDPNGRLVEASDLAWGLYFNKADGSSLADVTVQRYATRSGDMAALRVYSNGVNVSGVVVQHNARMGLSAIGSDIHVGDSTFNGNGYLGVHGNDLDGFVLERSSVQANNVSGFDEFHSAGGVKLTSSTRVTIRENDVSHNRGPGIWTDLDTNNVTIVANLVERNSRAGIEIELSDRVNALSNVALGNGEAGIWVVESQNVQVLHNASFDNVNGIEVEEGPRRDVAAVRVANNTLGRSAPGSVGLLGVNDWTEQRSAEDMGVTIEQNAFWVPPTSATPVLTRLGNWPKQFSITTDIDAQRNGVNGSSQSMTSSAESNPFVNSVAAYDYRWLDSGTTGTPLTPGAAEALGVVAGTALPIGPIAPVVQR
jgi:hypothetical protein